MGLEAAIITSRAQKKENKRRRRFEASLIEGEKQEDRDRLAKQERAGRTSLIKTTPQGVLGPLNTGRKRLTV